MKRIYFYKLDKLYPTAIVGQRYIKHREKLEIDALFIIKPI